MADRRRWISIHQNMANGWQNYHCPVWPIGLSETVSGFWNPPQEVAGGLEGSGKWCLATQLDMFVTELFNKPRQQNKNSVNKEQTQPTVKVVAVLFLQVKPGQRYRPNMKLRSFVFSKQVVQIPVTFCVVCTAWVQPKTTSECSIQRGDHKRGKVVLSPRKPPRSSPSH